MNKRHIIYINIYDNIYQYILYIKIVISTETNQAIGKWFLIRLVFPLLFPLYCVHCGPFPLPHSFSSQSYSTCSCLRRAAPDPPECREALLRALPARKAPEMPKQKRESRKRKLALMDEIWTPSMMNREPKTRKGDHAVWYIIIQYHAVFFL